MDRKSLVHVDRSVIDPQGHRVIAHIPIERRSGQYACGGSECQPARKRAYHAVSEHIPHIHIRGRKDICIDCIFISGQGRYRTNDRWIVRIGHMDRKRLIHIDRSVIYPQGHRMITHIAIGGRSGQ